MDYKMNIISKVKSLNLPLGKFVVVGGGCLAVRGIRETMDLDIAVLPEVFEELCAQDWPLDPIYAQKWHRRRIKKDDIEIYPDMLLEKQNLFVDVADLISTADVIEGMPFLNLQQLRVFKLDACRDKDLADIKLIDDFEFKNLATLP